MKNAGVLMQRNKEDFVQKCKEDFFCKFINDSTIPSHFFLHGKVAYHALGRIDNHSTTLLPATKKLSGTLPMLSANTASSMPSISQAEPIMSSIAVKMVLDMTLTIPRIIHTRNGRASFHGWCLIL